MYVTVSCHLATYGQWKGAGCFRLGAKVFFYPDTESVISARNRSAPIVLDQRGNKA